MNDNELNINNGILTYDGSGMTGIIPLEIHWNPKEDITVYELAMCISYINQPYPIMPYMIDIDLPHFNIIDHNKDKHLNK